LQTKKLLPVILLLIIVCPIFARDVEILVEDTDLGLPLEGAVIRSWDGSQHTCNADGRAIISVPDDRQVVIQAAYPGYDNGRLVIAPGNSAYMLGLRLSGVMEGRELVIEATRPGTSETRTGRSVAISGRDIAQTAEIGIIEDVMSSIKLLPGVGYAGSFNAQPSIRGGDPYDMNASLDGFYVFNPYHWGGGFSIFDPRMVQSAQLSHGVFSSRYGHTISGLLEITSKKPSPTETEFELGLNTSAGNFNLSLPFAGRGGILFMGRVTYYDPVIWLAKQAAKIYKDLEVINMIRVAPYIRSGTITGNYRFTDNLELNFTAFWGMDGVGVRYDNFTLNSNQISDTDMKFDWTNYQGFITTGLSWNPRNDMLLKLTAGTGYEMAVLDANISNTIYEKLFEKNPANEWYYDLLKNGSVKFKDRYNLDTIFLAKDNETQFNVQGRIDYDWEIGKGFLVAAGVQEMFSSNSMSGSQLIAMDTQLSRLEDRDMQEAILDDMGITNPMLRELLRNNVRVSSSKGLDPNAGNQMFTSSGYGLVEYNSPNNRFGAELGLRIDHFYLIGKDGFSLQTKPALNPRLNVDFNIFKNKGFVQSFDLSLGTGLFSSINSAAIFAEERYNISEAKANRSWTSVIGTKLELNGGFIVNIEAYYKHIFDRTYIPINLGIEEFEIQPHFNGVGKVWGFDILLQKLQSRYIDGWISYSYNWAKYRDPDGSYSGIGISGGNMGGDWYFPTYHRFHNLNVVLNIRPKPNINIYTRFGLASGQQLVRRLTDRPLSYPVYVYEGPGSPDNKFIEKYYWPSVRDENNRTSPSLPMDIKFSLFGRNNTGKVRFEVYVALENVLALLYTAKGNTSFNSYTGEVDTGSNSASYEIPIPIPSFGFKISY
jgi:hypothetical protein